LQNWLAQTELERNQWDEVHSSSLKELARRKVVDAVFAYGEYVFGYRPAAHHREMIEIMLDAVAKAGTPEAENLVIEEPRGHAKTTWGDTIFLCWLIAQFPHLRIGLLSRRTSTPTTSARPSAGRTRTTRGTARSSVTASRPRSGPTRSGTTRTARGRARRT
jgi:hypothetical protein